MSARLPSMCNPMLETAPSATADIDDGQVPLGLHISVTSLHDIDTTKETATVCFDADLFIKAQPDGARVQMDCGRVPTNRDEAVEELQAIFAESFVIGQLSTTQEEMTTDDWGEGLLPNVYGGEVKFTATIKVDMDLSDFPFDVQAVAIRFFQQYDRAYKIVSPARFWAKGSESLYATPLSTTPSALVSEEWELHAPLVRRGLTLPEETISAYSQVAVQLPLSRKGGAYVGRFITLMAAMSLAAVMPLAVPGMEPGDMLAYEVGLLFAVVAFQLLVSSFLPVSSTVSLLDKYGVFLFVFVFVCMTAVTFEARRDAADDDGGGPDYAALAGWLLVGWGAFHALFAVQVGVTLRHRRARLTTHAEPPRPEAYIVRDGDTLARPIAGAKAAPRRRSSVRRASRAGPDL